ncbi:hypothetical protein K443DRAFT_592057 [Laccaria amethystina LaAM-08-1]|uniref:Unplaced genomic scaffold K443scaffold_80, whole genome shotgun sequence n=1 Tax=Laccaria amethystina LaAM-08-1 TaxID=1095629 RepID=A0A0C9XHC2_9AGAR|nr:hypothetical protein K443DRAFT_592057 [Laccaria amethystina LaAM-08-1]
MKDLKEQVMEPPNEDRYTTTNHGSFNKFNESYNHSNNDYSTTDNSQHHTSNVTVNSQRLASTDRLREYAILAASSDSQEQEHISLCLSGTRAVILARILKWADSSDESPICWLHGPGGAGKTTIAATLAKKFASEGRLPGTFFFSRESALPGRRTTQNLVTTIACQLAISHPNVGWKIHRVIQAYPTVFSKSLQTQLESLVLVPTQPYTFPLLIGQVFWLLLELASALLPFLIFHSAFGNVTRMALQTCLTFLPIVVHLSAVYDATRFVALGVFPKWLPMIVILDGLDECDGKDSLELIKILAGGERNFSASIRFLITSRADDYIQGKFRLYAQRTQFINLMDFRAHDDIRVYFQDGFSVFFAENEGYMKGVEKPWPSASDLTALVEKSEGLFVYAYTLLKFVGDFDSGEGVPATRLKRAILRHDGLDGIYHQVFRDAPHSSKNDFKRLFGAHLLLRYPLPIDDLAQLLRIGGASEARRLLRGCKAILRFPDDVKGQVTFFHASLHDFLLEEDRSRENYIDLLRHHVYLLYDCFRIMASKWESISSNPKASQLPLNSYVPFFPSILRAIYLTVLCRKIPGNLQEHIPKH